MGNNVIYSQDLGYLILGLRILSPGNFVDLWVLLGFEDPQSLASNLIYWI